ncbi:hypothetical protein D1BOALGB6SA_1484 [Olavius sp. associated proteobacterium Delta 1]|nr:hypothetical protein D1BOALGB6SA_1484 [Olavius sp. associated proteobacterium Delta 1]
MPIIVQPGLGIKVLAGKPKIILMSSKNKAVRYKYLTA